MDCIKQVEDCIKEVDTSCVTSNYLFVDKHFFCLLLEVTYLDDRVEQLSWFSPPMVATCGNHALKANLFILFSMRS